MTVLGLDTSNYTTSIAFLSDDGGENCSRLLPVKPGELGLRQSDAVFHHTKSLPELSGRLFSHLDGRTVSAVGVSTRPRAVEGSYMPCFLVGYSHAVMLAQCLNVPLLEVSHQQGHVAAALWSADHLELMDQPHLAWHLSGGTTEPCVCPMPLHSDRPSDGRVVPFGNPRIKGYLHLPEAYRSLSRPSSPP